MNERELYPRGLTDERIERDSMARISRNLMNEMFPGCTWDDLEDDEREEFEAAFNRRAYRHY